MELDLAPVLTSRLKCCCLSGMFWAFIPCAKYEGVVW
jgi:hypothetical protein